MKRAVLPILLLATSLVAVAAARSDWNTPAETSDYRTTPSYDETMAYLGRIAAAVPRTIRIETFGTTGEGRDLVAVIASRDGVFDPQALRRANRPVVLIQNGIHAGEIDGKDACLALLRDMAVTGEKAGLLERAVVVVIPIYNADGHERSGPHNRINQNGPQETGWRTQAGNLNLNRDYMKADAPETRAFLRLFNRWLPDVFVDTHVTDGADYEYDTTYGVDAGPDIAPAQAEWRRKVLVPYLDESVAKSGHAVGPLIFLKDDNDPAKGLALWGTLPRFSTAYMVLQNRAGILVETHMLKDCRTRVRGTYEVLKALLEVVNRDAEALVAMNREADAAVVAAGKRYDPAARFPLRVEPDGGTNPFPYRSREFRRAPSDISGGERIEYLPGTREMTVPRETSLRVSRAVAPPLAYIVPAPWRAVIETLEAHGLALRRTTAAWTGEVETYRCGAPRFSSRPFEGRQVLFSPGEGGASDASLGRCDPVRERLTFAAGSAVVPLDQRAAKVAIHFLEPEAPDSAVAWGFFNAVFEQKEYAEPYVMEGLARRMLAADPKLKQEFEDRLRNDAEFAASPPARLDFFYRRSPYWDSRLGLYPVGRLASLAGLPLAGPPSPRAPKRAR
jgi:murein tripeptide amidase MpaA